MYYDMILILYQEDWDFLKWSYIRPLHPWMDFHFSFPRWELNLRPCVWHVNTLLLNCIPSSFSPTLLDWSWIFDPPASVPGDWGNSSWDYSPILTSICMRYILMQIENWCSEKIQRSWDLTSDLPFYVQGLSTSKSTFHVMDKLLLVAVQPGHFPNCSLLSDVHYVLCRLQTFKSHVHFLACIYC